MNRNTLRHLFTRQRRKSASSFSSRFRRHALPLRFHGHLEDLEKRQLLAADILATANVTVGDTDTLSEVSMDVAFDAAASDATARLVFNSLSAGNGSLDPRALEVRDSSGATMTPIESTTDGTTGESAVYALVEGSYTILVGRDNGTSGVAAVSVTLAGSTLTTDGMVSQDELSLIAAAHSQAQGGGNFVTDQFWQSLGIDPSVDLFDVGMDTNGNGVVDSADLDAAQANSKLGHVQITLSDASGPSISGIRLTSDTGIADDFITTDPTVEGVVTDDSQIVSFTVILDGGDPVDLLPLVGDINVDSHFQISLADWDTIVGGTLADGDHSVTFVAKDSFDNESTSAQLVFGFIRSNEDPVLVVTDRIARTDQLFDMFAADEGLSDPNTPPDVFTLDVVALDDQGQETSLPGWMTLQLNRLFGFPSESDIGVITLRATLTDTQGGSDTEEFTVSVIDASTPIIDQLQLKNDTGVSDTDGITTDPTVTGTVTDDDTITNFAVTLDDGTPVELPDLVTAVNADRDFEISAADLDTVAGGTLAAGAHTLTVSITDNNGLVSTSDPLSFVLIINNAGPELTNPVGDQTATENEAFTLDLSGTFTDSDSGDQLTLDLIAIDGSGGTLALPVWMSFDAGTGILSGTPGDLDVATHTLRLTATDSQAVSSSTDFELTVLNVNDPPLVGTIPDQTAAEDVAFNFDITDLIVDIDDPETLTITAALTSGDPLPGWLSLIVSDPFDPHDDINKSAVFSGTPTSSDLGVLEIRLTVTDSASAVVERDFTLTVTGNAAPVLDAIPDQTAVAGSDFQLDISSLASDTDPGDVITFAATLDDGSALPAWLSLNTTTGVFSGTPAVADGGTVAIRVTISDLQGATDSDVFEIAVNDVVGPVFSGLGLQTDTGVSDTDGITTDPTVVGTVVDPNAVASLSVSVDGGAAVDLLPIVGDINANPNFTISLANWDAIVGGTLSDSQHSVTFTAGDSFGNSTTSSAVSFSFIRSNQDPAIDVSNVVVREDEFMSLFVADQGLSDPNSPPDVFTLNVVALDEFDQEIGLPSWMTLTGNRLFGTPSGADLGNVRLRATLTDSQGATDTGEFTVSVVDADTPIISDVQLKNDTGGSATDRITTDPTITGTVADADAFTGFSASLDGGVAVSLPDMVTAINLDPNFELSAADLDAIAGGTLTEGSHALTITITDENASVGTSDPFNFTYIASNDAPVVTNPVGDQTATEDVAFSVDLSGVFTDPNGSADVLTLGVATADGGGTLPLPVWLTFNEQTGELSGTPTNSDVGVITLRLTATDSQDASTSTDFDLTVENVNDSPLLAEIVDQTATLNLPFILELSGLISDVDNPETLVITATLANGDPLPLWLSLTTTTPYDPNDVNSAAVLSGTPLTGDAGAVDIRITVTDLATDSATRDFTLTVSDNQAPVMDDIPNQTTDEASPFTLDVSGFASDVDPGDELTFSATLADSSPLPGWLSFDVPSATFSGTPGQGDVGVINVLVTVTDREGATDSDAFELTVNDVNQTPVVDAPLADQDATEDSLFSVDTSTAFSDPDSDTLVYSAVETGTGSLPSWLAIDPATGILSGTPTNDDVGQVEITVTATDSEPLSASDAFTITVANTNDAPVIASIPDQTATQDVPFSLDLNSFVTDEDVGDTVTLAATLEGGGALPAWLSLTAGVLSGTPGNADVGVLMIELTATDVATDSDSAIFQLTVENVNDAPELVSLIPNQTGTQDVLFTLDPTFAFSDPDGDTLTYSAQLEGGGSLPAWLSLNSNTGLFSGTPANGDVGDINVELTASDGELSVSDVFVLTVENVNDPPTLVSAIPDQTATVALPFSLGLGGFFEDIDVGDSLTYTAELDGGGALPAWLSLNASTGVLTGTPSLGDVTAGVDVHVTATDGSSATASDVFALAVTNNNSNPIAEDDSGFLVNRASLVAIPLAELLSNDSDPDGQALTPTVDSLSNLGATLTILSGHVIYDPSSSSTLGSLTPGQSQVDTFQYTVSDGAGGTDTATVSVDVSGEDNQVGFTFNFTDAGGGDVTQVNVGEDFNLEVYAFEMPTPDKVVFSAYLDVIYGGAGAQVVGNLTFNPAAYQFGISGDTTVDGLMNEVGALDGISSTPANGPILLVTVPMRATSAGTVRVVGDSTDDLPLHEVSRFDGSGAVPPDELQFESATLDVVSPAAAAVMLEDVNGDGAVSPVDALLVVRALDGATSTPRAVAVSLDTSASESNPSEAESSLRLDVNGDGHVSPVDALMVIRALDAQSTTSTALVSPVTSAVSAAVVSDTATDGGTATDRVLAEESSDGDDAVVSTSDVNLLARSVQAAGHADDEDDRSDTHAALDAVLAELDISV